MGIDLASVLSSTSLDLDDLDPVHCRNVVGYDSELESDSEAEVVGCLSDALDDEGQFEEALPLDLSVLRERDALSVIKIVLGDGELKLSC